jgi:hypothetical protein
MKRPILTILFLVTVFLLHAGIVEKTFYFKNPQVETKGVYSTIRFDNTTLSGIPGEPMFPYHPVSLMLPPGESAMSLEIIPENEITIPGSFILYPAQDVLPISEEPSGEFRKNEKTYISDQTYPRQAAGRSTTQYLNGHSFALSAFTPARYNPAKGALSYYEKITVRVTTGQSEASMNALTNLSGSENALGRVRSFAQNPEMADQYVTPYLPQTSYQYLIICPTIFKNEFQPLINMQIAKGLTCRVVTVDSIYSVASGYDQQEKIRNFIKSEYQSHTIEYVLLAGNPKMGTTAALVPVRGFYCYVNSGTGYTDTGIPSDLYYSALDRTFDYDNDHIYGELNDSTDNLPEVSVGRFTVKDTAELHRMIQKTVSYTTNPVLGEMNRPYMAGEFLYNPPMTFGGPYMDLLIDNHSDNGYFTHGIPSASNNIGKLYDTLTPGGSTWQWQYTQLITKLNEGRSIIHHLGHANTTYMMRMSMSAITNANFANINGVTHNFQILYTQGCYCGQIDAAGGCIAAKAVTINNWLVAGVFNTRYGWFNQGTTDGPSEHLEREFVNAMYNDSIHEKHLGTAHLISKIRTAPYLDLLGEFEPGAQRWVHYCCTVFGDPALEIWTEEPTSFYTITWTGTIDSDWNKAGNWNFGMVPTPIFNVYIPDTTIDPVINTVNTTFCHDVIIGPGGNLTINPGKSMIIRGAVIVQ